MTQLIDIAPSDVKTGTRYRSDVDLDEEFLQSIRDKGIIQPISVTTEKDLIAGGRRLAAAIRLGLPTIPAVIRETQGELDLRECELIENALRKDLIWYDRTDLVHRIHTLGQEKHGEKWSQQKTADTLNRSVGGINRQLQLATAIRQFPKLKECKTEDDAVKTYRKLGEQLIVASLRKQAEERAANVGGLGQDASDDGESDEVEAASETPLGMRLAGSALNHYRVGDALLGLEELASRDYKANISLVEVDPPYGIDLADAKKGDSAGIGHYNEIDQSEYATFLGRVCSLLNRVTPDSVRVIFWFGQEWYSEVKRALEVAGFQVDPIPGVWVKPAGQTASPDTYLARCYETFFVACKGKPPIRQRGRSNVFAFNSVPAAKKYHPTQRPIELIQELFQTFAYPGAVVLCPFLGSGTTIRAAYTCGMHCFGWDLSQEYKDSFIAQVERDREAGIYNKVLGSDE